MKLTRNLLLIGAAANAVFFAFHVWLGWRIHHLTQLDGSVRTLLELLNGGGALFILFLTLATRLAALENVRTRLGRLVIVFGFMLYGLRALVEFIIPPTVSPWIFATCAATASLYAAALVLDRRSIRDVSDRPFAA